MLGQRFDLHLMYISFARFEGLIQTKFDLPIVRYSFSGNYLFPVSRQGGPRGESQGFEHHNVLAVVYGVVMAE